MLTIALALLALACQPVEVGEPFDDPHERLRGKWANELQGVRDGDAASIAKLEAAFRTTNDADEKEVIAWTFALEDLPNEPYREHIRRIVRAKLAENAPFPSPVLFGTMRDGVSSDFKSWCKRKNMPIVECMHRSIIIDSLRMLHLRKGDEALLLEGLKQRNFHVATAAAQALFEVGYAPAIPQITAAAKRAPAPMKYEMAEAIALFDTPAAWAAVKSLGLPDEELTALREKVVSDSEPQ